MKKTTLSVKCIQCSQQVHTEIYNRAEIFTALENKTQAHFTIENIWPVCCILMHPYSDTL